MTGNGKDIFYDLITSSHFIKWMAMLIISIIFILIFHKEIRQLFPRVKAITMGNIFRVELSTPIGNVLVSTDLVSGLNDKKMYALGGREKQYGRWIFDGRFVDLVRKFEVSWPSNHGWTTVYDAHITDESLETLHKDIESTGFLLMKLSPITGENIGVIIRSVYAEDGFSIETATNNYVESYLPTYSSVQAVDQDIDESTNSSVIVVKSKNDESFSLIKIVKHNNYFFMIVADRIPISSKQSLDIQTEINSIFNSFQVIGE